MLQDTGIRVYTVPPYKVMDYEVASFIWMSCRILSKKSRSQQFIYYLKCKFAF